MIKKINMGCGKRNFGPDWIHIDGGNYDHLHSKDINILPFEDNTIDLIYSSHVLEYFDREEVMLVLKEWKRVLKTGAILRLAVPDFQSMAALYTKGGCTLEQILGPLYGKIKMADTTIYHKTTYDFNNLKKILTECGFTDICEYDWRKTEHMKHDDCSQAYLPHMDKENGTLISLNVQATKA